MKALRFVLKAVLGLAAAFVAVVLAITTLMAVGVIKPDVPKPPFPSVVVEAAPKATAPVALTPHASAKAPPQKPPTPAPSVSSVPCVLRAQGDIPVPVFPTESGLDEWTTAQASGNQKAVLVALMAARAFAVTAGTECLRIDGGGFLVKHVRVLSGPHIGQDGFVPTEWTLGK